MSSTNTNIGAVSSSACYGFVGIGVMGHGMARNIHAKMPAAATLLVCEINQTRLDQFLQECRSSYPEKTVEVARTPLEVVKKADIIITMLPQSQHVFEAFTNETTGFLSQPSLVSKLFLDCSSIDVATSTKIGNLVTSYSKEMWAFIDAPVSGGPVHSEAGMLTFMIGCDKSERSPLLDDAILPTLSMMGSADHIYLCGQPGAGLATKQLNNYLGYIGYLGLCEVMNTGIRYGLDPATLAAVINASSGMNWNSLHQNPVKGVNPKASSAKDFKGGFTTELAGGVIDDAVALMEQVGAKTVLANPMKNVFSKARKNPKCKGMEARSVWKLFYEDEGRDLSDDLD
ncbi:3-hydroxyisobutyrate dehydrogenase, variant [Xylogone sp. PMI_703]|nr:3-hydroxyisobutyrate dehydrogenase, variant [Xylogone sp. PMI_703]